MSKIDINTPVTNPELVAAIEAIQNEINTGKQDTKISQDVVDNIPDAITGKPDIEEENNA